MKALLGRHTAQARQVLRKLLTGKTEMEPVAKDGRRGYRFRGNLTLERLLSGGAMETTRLTVVAPTGNAPVASFRLAIPIETVALAA